MELRHLRYFTAVATERSFSRAAAKLHIAQPPLSRQIQQLEEELGVRLLDRGRPLTLTEPGRYLLEQARQVIQRVDELGPMTRRIAAGSVPWFTIGFAASTLYETLPDLIRRLRATTPGTEIQLVELTTLEQIAALKDGRIDAGFGRLRFDDEAVTRKVVREEPLALAVPSDHPLVGVTKPVRLGDAEGETLIIYPKRPRPSYADQALGFVRDAEVRMSAVIEAGELQTALGLVASGAGISLVPASVKRLGREDVRYIDLDEPAMSSVIIMSWRTGDASALLSTLRQLVDGMHTKGHQQRS